MGSREVEFTLPIGYTDSDGSVYRTGSMRMACALDEVEPYADPRVRANDAYLGILVLSRVLLRLGPLSPVPVFVVEQMTSIDYAFLQSLFLRLNTLGSTTVRSQCPRCTSLLELNPFL